VHNHDGTTEMMAFAIATGFAAYRQYRSASRATGAVPKRTQEGGMRTSRRDNHCWAREQRPTECTAQDLGASLRLSVMIL
jgi:hypothetical protein